MSTDHSLLRLGTSSIFKLNRRFLLLVNFSIFNSSNFSIFPLLKYKDPLLIGDHDIGQSIAIDILGNDIEPHA